MNETNFSMRLKSLRTTNNLTQTAVGKAVGLSTQAINDIEHNRRSTTTEKLVALADYFDVPLDFLVGRTNESTLATRNNIYAEYLSQRLGLLRVKKSISQQTIADTLGITKDLVMRIESGNCSISIETLGNLANYFEVSTDYLLGRSDTMEIASITRPKNLPPVRSYVDEQEIELCNIYRALDDYSRGMLLERARILAHPIVRPQNLDTD